MVNLPLLEKNRMKFFKLIIVFAFTLLSVIGTDVFAGGGPPGPPGGGGGGGAPCWPPPCVPIDGGISFLLVAGALYGGKKVYDISKNNEKTE